MVYCKDVNRRGDFSNIHFDFLGFQFRARKIMWVKRDRRIFAHSFQPAASPKALTRLSREIRSWALHHRSDKSLQDLAEMYNRASAAGSSTTATSTRRSCVRRWCGSMLMSFGGRVVSLSRCATRQRVEETGLIGSAGPTRRSLPIGLYVMAAAEHREPCDSRGSCTVLGARGGETPPRDSTSRAGMANRWLR